MMIDNSFASISAVFALTYVWVTINALDEAVAVLLKAVTISTVAALCLLLFLQLLKLELSAFFRLFFPF